MFFHYAQIIWCHATLSTLGSFFGFHIYIWYTALFITELKVCHQDWYWIECWNFEQSVPKKIALRSQVPSPHAFIIFASKNIDNNFD